MNAFWEPLILSVKLASIATLLLFMIGSFWVYVLSMYSFVGKSLLKALVSVPLVLPPTVLGYYLLISFHKEALVGSFFDQLFNVQLAFSFEGLVIASLIFSLPFMVNPMLSAIENLPVSFKESAFTLGKSKINTFLKVMIPNIKPAIVAACVMSFAHTIGEFGVILMIGGNIPGETRVASVAIYNEVEALNYNTADSYSLILLFFSILVLTLVYIFNNKKISSAKVI